MSVSAAVKSFITESELVLRLILPDGTALGPADAPATIRFNSDEAVGRIIAAPRELGFVRAYITGQVEIEGDLYAFLQNRDTLLDAVDRRRLLAAAPRLAAAALPPQKRPSIEAVLRGRNPLRRSKDSISYHYDIPEAFYELFLGDSMAYTSAVFAEPNDDLDKAQYRKYDVVCQKLNLQPGYRLLDVGCGWGGLAIHAAKNYGVDVVGITISAEQLASAERRIADEGLSDKIDIRLQDYRELPRHETFDAISAVGVFEHIGLDGKGPMFFDHLAAVLRPQGRLLNHAISRRSGEQRGLRKRGFVNRYVFPDGSAVEIGETVSAVQAAGLEVHHVESLRAHYGPTLRAWSDNLERNWDAAVELVGEDRARVWRLFMAGYALHFETFGIQHHQTLAVLPSGAGRSEMPLRPNWD